MSESVYEEMLNAGYRKFNGAFIHPNKMLDLLISQDEMIKRQREALHYFQEHGYSRKICSAALKESEEK